MGLETLIPAGAQLLGSFLSSDASSNAADTQAAAADRAAQISERQYQQTREDMAPWRQAGQAALGQITAGTAAGGDFARDFTLADFHADPGYEFRRSQGMRGLEGSAAARGGLLNGGTLKALDRYNQDYASGEYQNAYNRFNNDRAQRFNRLASVAGIGQTATRDVANLGAANASEVGNYATQGANARASGYIGAANALGSGLSTLGNWYQQRNMMGRSSSPAWDSGGYTGTNDPSMVSGGHSGNGLEWWGKYGSGGD